MEKELFRAIEEHFTNFKLEGDDRIISKKKTCGKNKTKGKRKVLEPEDIRLFDICRDIIKSYRVPKIWYANTDEIIAWLDEKAGIKNIEEVVRENRITGKILPILTASHLSKMNIKNFDEIKRILEEIRKEFPLIGKETSYANRRISLPPRDLFYYYYAAISRYQKPPYDPFTYFMKHGFIEDSVPKKEFKFDQVLVHERGTKVIVPRPCGEVESIEKFYFHDTRAVDKYVLLRLKGKSGRRVLVNLNNME